jgi:hypothetical protein
MCVAYDAGAVRQCTEDDADDVLEKARANFCDYFVPNPDAHVPGQMTAQDRAAAELAALFDETDDPHASPDGDTSALVDAEALFKP